MLSISLEEAEELAFVPGAVSEPRGAIYFCDNRCSEKAISYWQFASVVVEEGGEARTINLRQQCYSERQVQQGEPRLNSWQWRAVVEKKAHRGRIGIIMGNEQFTRGMWEYFTLEKAEAKKEYKVSGSRSLHSGRSWSMPEEMKTWSAAQKLSCLATRGRILEECTEKGKSSVWASGTFREAYEKVVKEETGRLGIVR